MVMKMNDGKRQIDVATELKISSTTVRRIWKRYMETGSTNDRARSGRPLKTSERERRNICITSKKFPFLTSTEVKNKVYMQNTISNRTVSRILWKAGLFAFKAAKKPKLSNVNIKKRMIFCKDYSDWESQRWQTLIFSDECRIQRFSTASRLVRRPVGCRFKKRYTIKTVKYGGFSVHLWGAIKGDGTRTLIKCPQRLNSTEYQKVLEEGLLPFYDTQDIFQQDGATCHKSKSSMNFLERQGITVLSDWPPQSPDISIIENCWSLLKARITKRNARTPDELWEFIEEEWYGIPNCVISNLYASIPRRLQLIQKNKGQSTRY